jgi:hypothetical protein
LRGKEERLKKDYHENTKKRKHEKLQDSPPACPPLADFARGAEYTEKRIELDRIYRISRIR